MNVDGYVWMHKQNFALQSTSQYFERSNAGLSCNVLMRELLVGCKLTLKVTCFLSTTLASVINNKYRFFFFFSLCVCFGTEVKRGVGQKLLPQAVAFPVFAMCPPPTSLC